MSFPVWNLRQRSRRLADRWIRFAWSVPLLTLGALVLAAVGGARGVPFAAQLLMLLVMSMPLAIFAGMIVRQGKTLVGDTVRVEGKLLVIERLLEPGREPTSFGPVMQGALTPKGAWLEDDAGRELTMDTSKGRELLDALAVAPEKHRFAFHWRRTGTRVGTFLAGGIGLLVSAWIVLGPFIDEPLGGGLLCLTFGVAPMLADAFSRWAADIGIEVGLDGVAMRSLMGVEMFRFADVIDVKVEGEALAIRTRDGRVHRFTGPADHGERAALEQRIREAMTAARAHVRDRSVLGAMLDRAGRSLPEWRAAIAKVLTAATGFRDGAVDEQEMVLLLDDVMASPEQRVAAAIALSEREALRPRIRVAAEACASPKLRVALEKLSEGGADDETLADAVAEADQVRRASLEPM